MKKNKKKIKFHEIWLIKEYAKELKDLNLYLEQRERN